MKIISLVLLILAQTLVDCSPIDEDLSTTEESSTIVTQVPQLLARKVRNVQVRTVKPAEHQHAKSGWSRRCCDEAHLMKEQLKRQESPGRILNLEQKTFKKREVDQIKATTEEIELINAEDSVQVTEGEATEVTDALPQAATAADILAKRQVVEMITISGSVEESVTITDEVVLQEHQDDEAEGITESPTEQLLHTEINTMDGLQEDKASETSAHFVGTEFPQEVDVKLRKRQDDGVATETTEQTTEAAFLDLGHRFKRLDRMSITSLNELKEYLERENPPPREDVDLDQGKKLLVPRQVEEEDHCSHHHHQQHHHHQHHHHQQQQLKPQGVEEAFITSNATHSLQQHHITEVTSNVGIVADQSVGVQEDLSRFKRSPALRQVSTTTAKDAEVDVESSIVQNQQDIWNFDNPRRGQESSPSSSSPTAAAAAHNVDAIIATQALLQILNKTRVYLSEVCNRVMLICLLLIILIVINLNFLLCTRRYKKRHVLMAFRSNNQMI